jgi:exoribonuclease R
MHYKIYVSDRHYNEYIIYNAQTMKRLEEYPELNPLRDKLLNCDIFTISENKKAKIVHSPNRESQFISGVLVLQGNKTYGKFKNKYFYRCIPDDKRLPEFLIPYKVQVSFRKHQVNKYVVFKFSSWRKKHPVGSLQITIGNVDELSSFYEYQMYCNSLYASISNLTKQTKKMLKLHSEEYYREKIMQQHNIIDRTDWNIITIDSEGSKDLDDAIGYKEIDELTSMVSIYISNVVFWFEALDLWSSFNNRIATIYLPDRKRPMLPTRISDDISSLLENQKRFAFTIDIIINKESGEIISYSYCNSLIKVTNNLRHKSEMLHNNPMYCEMTNIAQKMNKKKIYLDSVMSSHEVVSYFMVLMNYLTAKKMTKHQKGIYRFAKTNNDYIVPDNTPKEVAKFLKIWHSMGGQYCKYEQCEEHDMLKLESYLHITSPNRRLVDMLNMIVFQDVMGIVSFTDTSRAFYNKWVTNESIEYINNSMKSIRKVQSDCKLLNICYKDTRLTKKEIQGYIFDKLVRNDNLFQYIVYIPSLKMTNRFTTTENLENLSTHKFKIYIFMDEIHLKQKIRLLLI